ncbi:hypothetical protein [Flavobacterium sp.]|jgi:hypothetical protein|uniref:hypothetical protein n=1 Tax=Flavobacterium sp. TaxID=239 RepID=UPI0035B1F1AC
MVKRKVLEKLSDSELEKYLKPESRFVPEAIQFAYEILKERGKQFSEIETNRIENLINSKIESEKTNEPIYKNGWDKNLTENDNAIELYTNKLIWIFSIASGVIFGTVLQAINYRKVKNNNGLIFTILFGILYTIFQIYISSYVEENFPNFQARGRSLTFILSGIGATGLFVIREKIFEIKNEYKAKSFVAPLIISILIYIPIIYAMIKGL